MVSHAVTRHAARRSEPQVLGQRKTGMELVDRSAEPGPEKSTCRSKWRTQATPCRTPNRASRSRSAIVLSQSSDDRLAAGEPGQRPADAHQPVVDQHGHLLGQPFFEAQADQVAAGEFREAGRPRLRPPTGRPPLAREPR